MLFLDFSAAVVCLHLETVVRITVINCLSSDLVLWLFLSLHSRISGLLSVSWGRDRERGRRLTLLRVLRLLVWVWLIWLTLTVAAGSLLLWLQIIRLCLWLCELVSHRCHALRPTTSRTSKSTGRCNLGSSGTVVISVRGWDRLGVSWGSSVSTCPRLLQLCTERKVRRWLRTYGRTIPILEHWGLLLLRGGACEWWWPGGWVWKATGSSLQRSQFAM